MTGPTDLYLSIKIKRFLSDSTLLLETLKKKYTFIINSQISLLQNYNLKKNILLVLNTTNILKD